jgi:hypothetical protein
MKAYVNFKEQWNVTSSNLEGPQPDARVTPRALKRVCKRV